MSGHSPLTGRVPFLRKHLFQGHVPDRLMVGLLDSRTYNGSLDHYPFAFQKFGVTRIRQIICVEKYPYETLELNQNDNKRDLWGYHRFLQASCALRKHQESLLKPGDWATTRIARCTCLIMSQEEMRITPCETHNSKAMSPWRSILGLILVKI